MTIYIPLAFWLCVCACFDWKHREVPNVLTLPVMIFMAWLRLTGHTHGSSLAAWGIVALVFLGFLSNVGIGGADFKISAALALLDPQLAVWAWAGAMLWYLALRAVTLGHERPYKLPGVVGFAFGIILFTLRIH